MSTPVEDTNFTTIPDFLIKLSEVVKNDNSLQKIDKLLLNFGITNNTGGKKKAKKASKKNKTMKYKKFKGGSKKKYIKILIIIITMIVLFHVPKDYMEYFFNYLCEYPQFVFDNIIEPYISRFNMRNSIGFRITYPLYLKIIQAFKGEYLVFNGLWGLYLNSDKLIKYMFPEITDESKKIALDLSVTTPTREQTIEITKKSLDAITEEILPLIEDVDMRDYERMIIPDGSLLLTKRILNE